MPKKTFKSDKSFGDRLAAIRKATGLTQVQLAEQVGISQRMLSHYEHCEEYPLSKVLCDLCRALDVSADELLGLAPPPALTKSKAKK